MLQLPLISRNRPLALSSLSRPSRATRNAGFAAVPLVSQRSASVVDQIAARDIFALAHLHSTLKGSMLVVDPPSFQSPSSILALPNLIFAFVVTPTCSSTTVQCGPFAWPHHTVTPLPLPSSLLLAIPFPLSVSLTHTIDTLYLPLRILV